MACRFCHHELSDHCKSGVVHGNYKEESRMTPPRWCAVREPCKTRHCLNALCCCTEYKEAEDAVSG